MNQQFIKSLKAVIICTIAFIFLLPVFSQAQIQTDTSVPLTVRYRFEKQHGFPWEYASPKLKAAYLKDFSKNERAYKRQARAKEKARADYEKAKAKKKAAREKAIRDRKRAREKVKKARAKAKADRKKAMQRKMKAARRKR